VPLVKDAKCECDLAMWVAEVQSTWAVVSLSVPNPSEIIREGGW